MRKVFVICCNESVEGVVISNEEEAEDILAELRMNHFDKSRNSLDEYSGIYYWHIHKVNLYGEEE